MKGWERFAPLSGVVAVVLWIVGTIIVESTDYSDKEEPAEILRVLQEDTGTIIGGGLIFALGAVLFVWFLGSLRARLWLAEGGVGRLSALAYGSGLLAGLCLLLNIASTVQGAIDEDEISGDTAQTLQEMGGVFFGGTELMLIPMMVAVGLLTLRTRVLPIWLGWASFVLALILVIIPIGWAGVIFLFPIWVIVTSVLLFIRPLPPPGPPPHTTGFVGTS